MRRFIALAAVPTAAVSFGLLGPAAAFAADSGSHDSGVEFEADLNGSSATGPVLFGVAPGLVDWVTRDSEAKVDDGQLRVKIRGLVIPTTNTTNNIAAVTATVYCDGKATATSTPVPFSATGDADIRQSVSVPIPCGSPAVLIHPGTNLGRYIAFTN
jgi:hypothetical protein